MVFSCHAFRSFVEQSSGPALPNPQHDKLNQQFSCHAATDAIQGGLAVMTRSGSSIGSRFQEEDVPGSGSLVLRRDAD
jgi:hypothetical protein